MYVLTIYKKKRQLSVVETFEPPTEKQIQDALSASGEPKASFDISRRDFEPEDFEYREEVQ